jgi:hypothetical protein
MTLNIRLTERWTLDAMKQLIENTLKTYRVEFLFERPMLYCSLDSSFALNILAISKKHLDGPMEEGINGGCSSLGLLSRW